MKRRLAILLTAAILLLSSCAKQPQPQNTTTATIPTQETVQESNKPTGNTVISQKAMYAISLPPVAESAKADDGTVIFNSAYQNISLTLPEQEVADRIIVDFLNRTDKLIQHADSTLESAKQAYAPGTEWSPYVLQLRYAPQRLDAGVLSLYGEKTSYTGGAHAGVSGQSITYDLLTGDVINLADIMHGNVTGDTLYKLVTDALKKRVTDENLLLFTTFDETLKQLFRGNLSAYEDWCFTPRGILFYFDPYEIAPYSTGIVSVEIQYSQLTGLLKDAYFPAEEDLTTGNLCVTTLTEEQAEQYTQISEIILEEGKTQLLLYTDGAITDIRIATDSDTTVFAAYTLTPGDAIMVEADLASAPLSVSYRTGNQYMTRSILMNDGIITIE